MCAPIEGVASSQVRSPHPLFTFYTVGLAPLSMVAYFCSLQVLQVLTVDRPSNFSAPFSAWPGKGRWLPCALEPHPCEGRELLLRGGGGKCGEQLADCATRYWCTESN